MNQQQDPATDTTTNHVDQPRKHLARIGILVVTCLVVLIAVLYLFVIPSKFEYAIGERLPSTAEVVNSDIDIAPFDQIHRFAISFTDDQTRDLLVKKWRLQTGSSDIMSSSNMNDPSWWPRTQLDQIEQSGECYGRIDDSSEQWWTIWIDRNNKLLYLETGNW